MYFPYEHLKQYAVMSRLGVGKTTAHGPNLASYLFLYGLQAKNAKNGIYIFKWVKKIKRFLHEKFIS